LLLVRDCRILKVEDARKSNDRPDLLVDELLSKGKAAGRGVGVLAVTILEGDMLSLRNVPPYVVLSVVWVFDLGLVFTHFHFVRVERLELVDLLIKLSRLPGSFNGRAFLLSALSPGACTVAALREPLGLLSIFEEFGPNGCLARPEKCALDDPEVILRLLDRIESRLAVGMAALLMKRPELVSDVNVGAHKVSLHALGDGHLFASIVSLCDKIDVVKSLAILLDLDLGGRPDFVTLAARVECLDTSGDRYLLIAEVVTCRVGLGEQLADVGTVSSLCTSANVGQVHVCKSNCVVRIHRLALHHVASQLL
jgi:hypothetical protein